MGWAFLTQTLALVWQQHREASHATVFFEKETSRSPCCTAMVFNHVQGKMAAQSPATCGIKVICSRPQAAVGMTSEGVGGHKVPGKRQTND